MQTALPHHRMNGVLSSVTNNSLNPFCARSVTCVGRYIYENGVVHCDRTYPDHILIYFVAGSWEIWQNGIAYTPHEGECILLHADHHHYGFKECEPGTHTLFLHFSANPSDCLLPEEDSGLEQSTLCIPTVFPCSDSKSIQRRFEKIYDLFWSAHTPKRTAQLNAYLQLLLTDLYERESSDPLSYQIVRLANQLIQENPRKSIPIEELAERLNISKRTATRKFRLATQTSFLQYQIEYRLNVAFNLLKSNPLLTNKAIALSLGFYDEYHFGKLFRKHFGFTPNKVRKNRTIDLV